MPQRVINKLVDGFETFRKENYELDTSRMKELVEQGQHPKALVIACCDSRSCPETIMKTDPGELFVGRQIAALIPPHDPTDEDDTVAASIEYAVKHLKVQHIIIVGHTSCGGIEGLANGVKQGAVGHWIQRAKEITARVEAKNVDPNDNDAWLQAMEKESVVWSLDNLKTYPCVQDGLNDGTLFIHGWQFDMTNGHLNAYDPDIDGFERLKNNAVAPSAQLHTHCAAHSHQ